MSAKSTGQFSPWWAVSSVGMVSALAANLAWGQLVPPVPAPPVPSVPGVVQDATNTAQDAAKDATNAAQETAKEATDAAKDAADTAKDAAKDTTDAAADTAKNAANAANNAANTAKETAKDATDDAKSTATDAAKTATNAAKDAQRDATNAARDTAGTARDVRGTTREATRDARETTRDAARDVRETARDVNSDVRDTARDVRDTARDTNRDLRETTRETARDAREIGRDVARDVRSTSATRAWSDYRSADLGIWFDRSARTNNGLVIADVAADAALGRFGFVEGDRIVSVGGQTIANETDFVRMLLNNNARNRMNVIVMRDGQQQTLYVDPVVLRQQITTVTNVDPLETFGVVLDDRYNDRLIVWRVIPRSPAFYAGIRAGDVITTFGGQRIANAAALLQIVQRTQPGMIPIQITRNGRTRTIEADMQVARHTSARQDLDTNNGTRTDETYIRSDVDADLQAPGTSVRARANANADLPADTAPAINQYDRPSVSPSYDNSTPRRGVLRRRR